jgi:two-component system OmpR family sensor kinase/two-component system sensor histidine kinase QseC
VPGPRVSVQGDRVALALLVRNLADNALRYSQPGARVELRWLQEGANPLLVVDDDGPGIPAEDRERVFDRFHRRASGEETGSGLGLAIVRSVAERHGAEVTLGDSPLGGLRVTVRFAPAVAGLRA